MPCTGHPLVTTCWPRARTFGCKTAAVLVPLKKKRALTQPDPSSNRSSCPLACHTSRQHNFSSKVRKDGKADELCVQVHVARVLCNVKRNCCSLGYNNNTQHYISFFKQVLNMQRLLSQLLSSSWKLEKSCVYNYFQMPSTFIDYLSRTHK